MPVFYQKGFTNTRGLLWVYDRKLGTCKELHPASICCEKDFYTIKHKDAPWDRRIESKVLAAIDSLVAPAIRALQTEGSLNVEWVEEIAFVAALQFTRVLTFRAAASVIQEKATEELMRITFANTDRARREIERYVQETGNSVDVSPESMVDAVQGKHIEISATEVPFLRNMLVQAVKLSRLIAQLDWQILVASAETGFVTCDCPVAIVPPRGSDAVGFLMPGAVKYFPLTRSLCLRLGDLGPSLQYRRVVKETVRIINQNIAVNSERFIMGPDKAQMESIIRHSGSAKMELTPRVAVETVEADNNSASQKGMFRSRRCFYPDNGSPHGP